MVHEQVKPKFSRARQGHFTLKNAVEEELSRLEKVGGLEKIEYSGWAMPVVVFPKKKSCVRLCGDYRITLNPAEYLEQYLFHGLKKYFPPLQEGSIFQFWIYQMRISNCCLKKSHANFLRSTLIMVSIMYQVTFWS